MHCSYIREKSLFLGNKLKFTRINGHDVHKLLSNDLLYVHIYMEGRGKAWKRRRGGNTQMIEQIGKF